MRFIRAALASLFVLALALTSASLTDAAQQQTTQQKETTTQETSKTVTTPTGFATGTKCTKSGTFKAENKYMRVVIVVAEGEEFPPFVDGEKIIWFELTQGIKSSFDAIKVSPDSN
jgi:hypothetical protein